MTKFNDARYSRVLTGFGFSISATGAGGSVATTLIESDRQICQQVVGYLEARRVIFDDPQRENWQYARESVQAIRDYCTNQKYRPASKTARESIRTIEAACIQFATMYDKYSNATTTDPEMLAVSLLAMRDRVGEQLVALVAKYKLDTVLDLTDYEPKGVSLLVRYFHSEPWPMQDPDALEQIS